MKSDCTFVLALHQFSYHYGYLSTLPRCNCKSLLKDLVIGLMLWFVSFVNEGHSLAGTVTNHVTLWPDVLKMNADTLPAV